jgi:hypothetical protein
MILGNKNKVENQIKTMNNSLTSTSIKKYFELNIELMELLNKK